MNPIKWVFVSALTLVLVCAAPVYADTSEDPTDSQADPVVDTDNGDPQQPTVEDDDIEPPSYANAAQAMHAANLAEAAAATPDQATLNAADALRDARNNYEDAVNNPDDLEALEMAQRELEMARENYAEAIENLSGVLAQDIKTMRQEGMGWGQIAHELGVHPGALGLGHGKKKSKFAPIDPVEDESNNLYDSMDPESEIAEATRRDMKTGWHKGHGLQKSKSKGSKKEYGLATTSGAALAEASGNKSGNKGGKGGNSGSKNSGKSGNSNKGGNSDGGKGNSGKDKGGKGNSGKDKGGKGNNGGGKGKSK